MEESRWEIDSGIDLHSQVRALQRLVKSSFPLLHGLSDNWISFAQSARADAFGSSKMFRFRRRTHTHTKKMRLQQVAYKWLRNFDAHLIQKKWSQQNRAKAQTFCSWFEIIVQERWKRKDARPFRSIRLWKFSVFYEDDPDEYVGPTLLGRFE